MKVKEESEKAGLKFNIQKTKIMASCLITSQQTEGKMWKLLQIFFSWALKPLKMVTATMKLKDTCSLKESYDKCRQCILESRDITLPTKVCIVGMAFLVVMYKCESWTIKKAAIQRSNSFKLW